MNPRATLKPHPKHSVFADWFVRKRKQVITIDGIFYRVAGPRHTTIEEILSGVGGWMSGGRWNPPGIMKVIYGSKNPITATIEAVEHLRYYGIPEWKDMPKVIIA